MGLIVCALCDGWKKEVSVRQGCGDGLILMMYTLRVYLDGVPRGWTLGDGS